MRLMLELRCESLSTWLFSSLVFCLKPCFHLIHAFILFCFLLHFSCCFACYLDTHTQIPIFPNSIIPPPIHCTPQSHLPSHPWCNPPPPPSRQRSQIDEEHGRCSPHDKQTRPIWPPTWQRTGTGAQCRYTPLTWSPTAPPSSWESDLSHGLNQILKKSIYQRIGD